MSALQNAETPTRRAEPARKAIERVRLRVVPATVQDSPLAPFVVLVFVLLAGGVTGLLMFNTSMQQASFRATALENHARDLTAQKQSLALDLARLRDPQQLAARAKELGMVVPESPAFIRLSDGTVLGKPTPATPLDAMRINPLPAAKPPVLAPEPNIVKVPAPDPATSGAVPPSGQDAAQPAVTGPAVPQGNAQ